MNQKRLLGLRLFIRQLIAVFECCCGMKNDKKSNAKSEIIQTFKTENRHFSQIEFHIGNSGTKVSNCSRRTMKSPSSFRLLHRSAACSIAALSHHPYKLFQALIPN